MSYLVIDLESCPDEALLDELKPKCKLGNVKDPLKVAVKEAEWEENGQVKAMSLDPAMCQIVSLQMWSSIYDDFVDMEEEETEGDMLRTFAAEAVKHVVVVGHNVLNFDLPVIMMRALLNQVKLPKIKSRRYSSEEVFDTMEMLAGWQPDRRKSLEWWGRRLGLGGKSGSGSEVYQMWKDGRIEDIHKYCRDDVTLCRKIYEQMINIY